MFFEVMVKDYKITTTGDEHKMIEKNVQLFLARIVLLIGIFTCSFNSQASESTENWLTQGYTSYPDNDGDVYLIRDNDNQLKARIELFSPGLDPSNPDDIKASIAYTYIDDLRLGINDVNKNGLIDQALYDNFNNYSTEVSPNDSQTSKWSVFGRECIDVFIQQDTDNKWLTISFDSIPGIDDKNGLATYCSFGMISKNPQNGLFDIPLDATDMIFSFHIRSNLSDAITQVITPLITPQGSSEGVTLPIYKRLTVPASDEGWTELSFELNDFNVDLTQITEIGIVFMQTEDTDIVAAGWIDIDNIKLMREDKIITTQHLDTELTLHDSLPNIVYPGEEVTVQLMAHKTGAILSGTLSLNVFKSENLFQNYNENRIYESDPCAEINRISLGMGEQEIYEFSFQIPSDCAPCEYKILGIIHDNEGNVVETIGPDKSYADLSELAYITLPNLTVLPAPETKPVALFNVSPSIIPIDNDGTLYSSTFTIDATNSYSVAHEIVYYEFDTGADGTYEYTSSDAIFHIEHDFPDFNPLSPQAVSMPVVLRVTDNEGKVDVKSDILNFAQFGAGLTVNVNNLTTAGSGVLPKCIVYDSTGRRYVKAADESGIIMWNNLPAGLTTLEIREYKNDLFDGVQLSVLDQVILRKDQMTVLNVQHNTPKIENVEIRYADNDALIYPNTKIEPGTNIIVDVRVHNPTPFEKRCRVKLELDKTSDFLFNIDINPSDTKAITASDELVFSIPLSLPEPGQGVTEQFLYALRVDTEVNNVYIKTDEQTWTEMTFVSPFPDREKEEMEELTFSGIQWNKIKRNWKAGWHPRNAYIDNDGHLIMHVQDYSGVGGIIMSQKDNYQYGIYKARMQASSLATELPEGVELAFAYYWDTDNESGPYELQEIDVELRSIDTGYAALTVHNRKIEDTKIHFITFFSPLDISAEHLYEFRWTEKAVCFYIDNELAQGYLRDNEGNPDIERGLLPVIIDDTNFSGRIPYQPSKIHLNHWSGGGWVGVPPQGKGDSIAVISEVSYMPVPAVQGLEIYDEDTSIPQLNSVTTGTPILKILADDHFEDDTPMLQAIRIADTLYDLQTNTGSVRDITINVNGEYTYIDNEGLGKSERYYQLLR